MKLLYKVKFQIIRRTLWCNKTITKHCIVLLHSKSPQDSDFLKAYEQLAFIWKSQHPKDELILLSSKLVGQIDSKEFSEFPKLNRLFNLMVIFAE